LVPLLLRFSTPSTMGCISSARCSQVAMIIMMVIVNSTATKRSDRNYTYAELQRLFSEDDPRPLGWSTPSYARRQLRGTRPFWNAHRHELEAYVRFLLCPGLFITFGAADYHW